jgi:hypothetical protein
MTFQPGANNYAVAFGTRPDSVEVPHIDIRAPASTDVNYPIGKLWINTVTGSQYVLTALSSLGGTLAATWIPAALASGTTAAMIAGAVTTLNAAVTPTSTIVYARNITGGTAGNVSITAQTLGSFTLTSSSGSETSTYNYYVTN